MAIEPTGTPPTASVQMGSLLSESTQALLSNEPKLLNNFNGISDIALSCLKSDNTKSDYFSNRDQIEVVQEEDTLLADQIKMPLKQRKAALLQSKLGGYYSNANLLDVRAFLNKHVINTKNPNQVLYEGEILKFKSGENHSWVERWCKVTPSAFIFYNGDLNNQCWNVKPTMIIPIADILSVLRVTSDLTAEESSKHAKTDYFSSRYKYKQVFQFEIFTENDDYPYKEEIDCDILNQNAEERENQRKRAKREEQNLLDTLQIDRSKLLEYRPEKLLGETRLTISKKSILDRPLLTHRTFRKTRESVQRNMNSSSRNPLEISCSYFSNPSNSPSKSPSTDKFNLSKIMDESTLSAPKKDISIYRATPKKEPVHKWTSNFGDTNSWSNKEREWYFSRKRMLFGCSNMQEREKWLALLSWLAEKKTTDT